MYLIMPQSHEIRKFRKEQNKQHISDLTDPWNIAYSTKAFREPKYKFLRNRLIYLNSPLYWETSSTGE